LAPAPPDLFGRIRVAGAPQTYLVVLRNARVARAAATALEGLHEARGDRAAALVPPARGSGFARWVASPLPAERQRLTEWCAAYLPSGGAPLLVGLDEDGLASQLDRLSLTACIGVPPRGAAAMRPTGATGGRVQLVPATTVRELLQAVLATAGCPAQAPPVRTVRPGPLHRVPAAPTRAGLAGLAGALAIAGAAPAAAAAAQVLPSPAAHLGHQQPGTIRPSSSIDQPGSRLPSGAAASTTSGQIATTAATAAVARQIPGPAGAAAAAAMTGAAERAGLSSRGLPALYTVRPGDSLSSIAGRFYHNQAAWPVLYWGNHRHIRWADLITPGQRLRIPLPPTHIPSPPELLEPAPSSTITSSSGLDTSSTPYVPQHARPAAAPEIGPAAATAGDYPGGAFGACVVARESGGNPDIWNASGHWGLYQFSEPTWAEYGGDPADFGTASVAEQNQVFATALADDGQSNWAPYDGC
jgi:nucleoid-associated protein YgaU